MARLSKKLTVGEFMANAPPFITFDMGFLDAADCIGKLGTCTLVILNQENRPWSIITSSEILRLQEERDVQIDMFWERPLYSFNLRALHHIGPQCTIDDAYLQMSAFNVKRLPVVQDDKVLGMVTLQSVLERINQN